jgi:pescadillo
MGEKITWIVPHERGIGHVTEVDFNVMATFVDFYVAMISFVNFRLYKSLGLFYPPKLSTNVDEKNFVFEGIFSCMLFSITQFIPKKVYRVSQKTVLCVFW